MTTDNLSQSKFWKGAMLGVGMAIVLGVVFCLGMAVGTFRANYSHNWGENYYRNMMGVRPGGMMRFPQDEGYLNPHGGSGSILKIDATSLVIKDKSGLEKVINIGVDTVIKAGPDTIQLKDLKIDENVVVLGADNASGQVDAKLIRVMPAWKPVEEQGFVPAQTEGYTQNSGQGRGGMMHRNYGSYPVDQLNGGAILPVVQSSPIVAPVVIK